MTYPYVQSATDLGVAKGPRLAITWHMAEGGGTVGYLSKPNPNGVSVHFVIQYTGAIVQMLQLSHMQSSLRTSDIRTTDDAPFGDPPVTYGRTAALEVMGNWADISHGTLGPNHASIGVEMEGFAAVGPNAVQRAAMSTLWLDMSAQFPDIRSLGHRDFQDYKSCPGKLIPWLTVGGHGAQSDEMRNLIVGADRVLGDVPPGTPYFESPNGKQIGTTNGVFEWMGSPTLDDGTTRDPAWVLIVGLTDEFVRVPGIARYIKRTSLLNPRGFPAPPADCADDILKAIQADRAKAHIVYT